MGEHLKYNFCPKCETKMYEGPHTYPGFVDGELQDPWFCYQCPGCGYEEKMLIMNIKEVDKNVERRMVGRMVEK